MNVAYVVSAMIASRNLLPKKIKQSSKSKKAENDFASERKKRQQPKGLRSVYYECIYVYMMSVV